MSSPAILSDQLECAICIDQLWEPKLLNCGHTFCLKCLEELFDPDEYPMNPVVACPVCRKKTPIPSKGISGLNTNFALHSLLEALSPVKPVTSSGVLTVKEDGEATVCEIHKEVRKFYCCTCETLICRDCTVVDHPRPEHKCMNLDEAYNWRCQLNQKGLQLSTKVVKLAKKSATILEAAKATLNERCDQVLAEIEASREAGLDALQAKIQAIEVFRTDVNAEIKVLRELTQDASKTEVLDQSKSLIEGMASVRSQQNEVLDNPEPVQYPQFMGTSEAIQGWPHLINLDGSTQRRQRKPRPKQQKDASASSSLGQEALKVVENAAGLPLMGLGLGICDQSQQGHYSGGGGHGRGGRGGGRGHFHKGRGGNRGRGGSGGTSN